MEKTSTRDTDSAPGIGEERIKSVGAASSRGRSGRSSKYELITQAYAAFNRRDIDSVLGLMASDVNWPNGMEGGRVVGHDQVRAYWTRQWGILNPRVDPVDIEENGTGGVVVRVHQVVHDLSGNLLVDHFIQHLYSFKGDRIERMDIGEASEADRAKDIASDQD